MATQQLKEQVQQHDEDAESSQSGWRSPSRTPLMGSLYIGEVYEQVPEEPIKDTWWSIWARETVKCMSKRNGEVYEQVPALICDSYARRSLRAAAIWGGGFCS